VKLYEYMGKEMFAKYGIPVPKGRVIHSVEEAQAVATDIAGPVVVKSQILSGKRGKAGGIKFADTPAQAGTLAGELLGTTLNNLPVEFLLIEEKLKIDKELYLAITLESSARRPVILTSVEGGMDIEDVPEEKIVKYLIDLNIGIQPFVTREINRRLGLSGPLANQLASMLTSLYRMFREMDAELVEINPLVVSGERLIAADAKVTIDDDALYRHKDLPKIEERTVAEQKAHAIGLSYVELDGDIAVMANGAGITMATLDILQYYGGKPANFLDAGGGASVEQTAKALDIVLSTNPKALFINVFGGITRCDDVAKAFIQVKNQREIPIPVVIRLVGTNEEEGVRLLEANGISAYKMMHEAAAKVVELARGN